MNNPLMEAIEIVCILKGKIEDGVDNETGYFLELAKQISQLAEDNGLDEGYIDEVFEGKKE
tara:strand:+ start:1134 stop:1316 length:183 start_codon:yes stop_codon:yes gene_type:complete